MLQGCWSECSCMRKHIVMEEHYTKCQHSTPFVLNCRPHAVLLVFRNTLLTLSDWTFYVLRHRVQISELLTRT
jgi:hypothetical protein